MHCIAENAYEYLTRQVASGGAVRGGLSLTGYYDAHGNPPGRGGPTGRCRSRGRPTRCRCAAGSDSAPPPNDEAQMLGRPFLRRREPEDNLSLVAPDQAFSAFANEHGRAPRAGAQRECIRW